MTKKRFLLTTLCCLTAVGGIIYASNETPKKEIATENQISGDWSGTLDVGVVKLTLVLHVSEENGALKAKIDCIEQGLVGMDVDSISLQDGQLKLEIKNLLATFEGSFKQEGVSGKFTQNGLSFPLTFAKGAIVKELAKRPQEPKAPFSYLVEEVSYENPSAGITISGTLTLPKSQGPFAAVLLIAGSGPFDRDESIFGHKPFWVIADHLTKQGIAVLRVDKRGVGKSTGNYKGATTEDFANDALAGVAYLKSRSDVKKIGLIGHSEGGIIAPLSASKSKDISFIVLLAGTAVNGEKVVDEQYTLLQRANGVEEEKIQREKSFMEKIWAVLKKEKNDDSTKELRDVITSHLAQMTEEEKKSTFWWLDDAVPDVIIQSVDNPWYRFFITYDPSATLKKVKIPVLALYGEKDLQVSPKQNLPVIAQVLKESGNKDSIVIEIPKLNHCFQTCSTGSVKEYPEIEETFSPIALQTITDWIAKRGE